MPKRLYQVSVTPTTYGERSTACVLATSEAAAVRCLDDLVAGDVEVSGHDRS
jgi:hypothetical protein